MNGVLKISSFPHKYTTTTVSAASPPETTKFSASKLPSFSFWFSTTPQINSLKKHHFHHREQQESKQRKGFLGRRFCSMRRNHEGQSIKPNSPLLENKDKLAYKSSSSTKLLTLPTILTIGRVASVPVLVATFYIESWWGPPATTCIFIAAAVTDWLDGYLARRMKLGTAFGAFLDPVADKLMVAATLVLLCTRPMDAGIFGQAPWLLPVPAIAIIGREITMSAVREWAASQGSKLSEAVAVNNLGKWKTATQMIALTILLGTRSSSIIGRGALVTLSVLLLYFSAWLAVWSLVVYMKKIWKVLVM